jgi:hypothetical protein
MPEWLKPYLNAQHPESPKALVLWQSAAVLAIVFGACGLAAAIRILWKGDLATGAVALVLGLAGILGGLAGFHKQADPTNKGSD